MNALIVDDNKIARTTMKQLSSQVKDIILAGECANAMDAYNLLQEQHVDLILLDIEMPGMTGLELTKNLDTKRPVIIFTTSKIFALLLLIIAGIYVGLNSEVFKQNFTLI